VEEKQNQNYISLLDAAKRCSYSEPYLRLRARQGKLKSIKLGKKWVTTAAWLDDYDRRIQAWRQAAEAKKKTNAAAFVVAPDQISQVLEPAIDPPSEQDDLEAAPSSIPPTIAVFCDDRETALPPVSKRLKTMALGGQIYPVPKQEPVKNIQNQGWLGALVSGAICALLLFMVMNPAGVSNLAGMVSNEFGRADIGAPVSHNDGQSQMIQATSFQKTESPLLSPSGLASPTGQNDPLKALVMAVEAFLNGF